ncbi:Uncharacterised protein [Dermatophilus congolensis]|uniref:Uncharacterized protein n=1 Tax=Dermatophilus congolensis TaxID=1863 RepID=A0A239VT29_9MICO|nr:hypothetical protein [Dermatophilus congolensis]SNV25421.1 Uncharacterised protein [Dermatophilus congolensis]
MNHPLPDHHLTTTPGDERGEHHPVDALRDTTIAITGGTGSFGSTMARRLLKHGVKKSTSSPATKPNNTTCA